VIYIDGMQFGTYHVISAVGVDETGAKHRAGFAVGRDGEHGSGESSADPFAEHGVNPQKRYLFVIDGAKALRAGITEVFGAEQAVQRCRTHKDA